MAGSGGPQIRAKTGATQLAPTVLAAEGQAEGAHQAVQEALRITPEISLASQEYILRNPGLDEALLADRLKYLAIASPSDLN